MTRSTKVSPPLALTAPFGWLAPPQDFFTNEVGLPLTMIPNYETYECKFCFGATPLPPATDPAFATPCFSQCPTAKALLNAQVSPSSPAPHLFGRIVDQRLS